MIDLIYVCYFENLVHERRRLEPTYRKSTADRRFVAFRSGETKPVVGRDQPTRRKSLRRGQR